MGLDFGYIDGQTPIEEDESLGLLIETIATRQELDEFEQQNIEETMQWLYGKKFKPEEVYTEKFVCNLHKRMYSYVWAWAGQYRKTDKNIGIDKWQIPTALRTLCDDALYWFKNETYPPEEIAIRFKHCIVSIHCFPNGNGRHSRLMADIIIEKLYGESIFTWGAGNLVKQGDTRTTYLNAITNADRGDFEPLMKFARS